MSTSVSIDPNVKAAAANTSAYYPFMENTGNLREWSVTQIKGESLLMKPVGAGVYVVSLALSVVEAALMTIVNLAIVLKNLLTCNCSSSEESLIVDDAKAKDASKVDDAKGKGVTGGDEEEPVDDVSVVEEQPKVTVTSNAGKAGFAGAAAAGLAWLTGAAVAAPIAIPAGAALATGLAVKSGFDVFQSSRSKATSSANPPAPKAPKAKVKTDAGDAE